MGNEGEEDGEFKLRRGAYTRPEAQRADEFELAQTGLGFEQPVKQDGIGGAQRERHCGIGLNVIEGRIPTTGKVSRILQLVYGADIAKQGEIAGLIGTKPGDEQRPILDNGKIARMRQVITIRDSTRLLGGDVSDGQRNESGGLVAYRKEAQAKDLLSCLQKLTPARFAPRSGDY